MEGKKLTGGGRDRPESSPKLKMAALEIKKILEQHDIAGVVHLFEPGFNEYLLNLHPSFSCVDVNEVGQLKIIPPVELPDQPEIHKKKIADTVNMLANLRLHAGKLSLVLTQAEMATRQHFGVKMPPRPSAPIITNPNFINGKKRPG